MRFSKRWAVDKESAVNSTLLVRYVGFYFHAEYIFLCGSSLIITTAKIPADNIYYSRVEAERRFIKASTAAYNDDITADDPIYDVIGSKHVDRTSGVFDSRRTATNHLYSVGVGLARGLADNPEVGVTLHCAAIQPGSGLVWRLCEEESVKAAMCAQRGEDKDGQCSYRQQFRPICMFTHKMKPTK